jgi:hypothetical protein
MTERLRSSKGRRGWWLLTLTLLALVLVFLSPLLVRWGQSALFSVVIVVAVAAAVIASAAFIWTRRRGR